MIAEPLDNPCFTHRHQIPSIQANIQCLRACTTESLNLNRIVRLQTSQVKCGAVFQPPVIMVADHTMQMLAIERSQAVLQMGQRCAETDITQNPQLVIRPTKVLI